MSAFRLDTNELLLVVFLVLAIVALFAESLIAALISPDAWRWYRGRP